MLSGPSPLFKPKLNTTSLISSAIGIYESIARSSSDKIGEMRSSRVSGIEGLEKENKLSNELNRKKFALRGSISKHATIICYYLNIYSLFNPQNIAKLYPFSEYI